MHRINQLFDSAGHSSPSLILDGAMGSLLISRGVPVHSELWMSHANILFPSEVLEIHKNYIKAGADIITTNTFRTNPAALINSEFTSEILVTRAVELAMQAREDNENIIIAGSNAPAEDCYKADRSLSKDQLINNHHKHIDLLINSGCDFILNETQSHFDEIKIICEYCSVNKFPFVVSLFFDENLKLLSGEDLFSTIEIIKTYEPAAIGFNCIRPDIFNKAIAMYNPSFPWGFYLNLGSGNYTDEIIVCSINEQEYLTQIKKYMISKPAFIGACCGSGPEHIKIIREYLNELYRNQSSGKN